MTATPHSPFQTVLGDAFARLPEAVRRVHAPQDTLSYAGRSTIVAARHPLAWLACFLLGLPRPGDDVAVSVSFQPRADGSEFWQRRFADRGYRSVMTAGSGAARGLLLERFGPFVLQYGLAVEPRGLAWKLLRFGLPGLPLPRWLLPRVDCLEGGEGERFTFDIDVALPLLGWLIHYRGWLQPTRSEEGRA